MAPNLIFSRKSRAYDLYDLITYPASIIIVCNRRGVDEDDNKLQWSDVPTI